MSRTILIKNNLCQDHSLLRNVLVCKNFNTMFCHHKRVLPLCAWQLVACNHLPTILVVGIDKHLPCAHVYHRFDGEHHAWNDEHALAFMTIMENLWIFMKFQSHTMSSEVANHTIMIFFCMFLDGMTYVANKTIGLGCFSSNLQTFLGDTHQLFLLGSGLAYDEHA